MNLGITIKKLRKSQGIIQVDFAEKLGITQTYLSLIESGIKNPSPGLLESIGKELKVPDVFIYFLSASIDDIPAERKEHYRMLEPILKNLINEIIGSNASTSINTNTGITKMNGAQKKIKNIMNINSTHKQN